MRWRRPTSEAAHPVPTLTSVDVKQIYEVLLGRSASANDVALQLAATSDWRVLLRNVADSDECHARLAKEEDRKLASTTPHVNIWHPDLSEFSHSPGTWSPDGEAVMGKDGWIYLGRGSNSVIDQYGPDLELPPRWMDRWTEVVRTRRDEAREMGISLSLLLVPDKLSVLSGCLPDNIVLERQPPAEVLSRELGVTYPVRELEGVPGGAYMRTDTHLSLAGNAALAAVLFAELGCPIPPDRSTTVELAPRVSSGDLGQRFEPSIVEILTTLDSWEKTALVEDNYAEVRAAGLHLGIRRVLRNDSAVDPRVVVVFGDSYSFPAAHYQSIAWSLAQHFGEVHFVWSPFGWDREYVEQVGAEVVVCETAERFVPRPPEPRFEVAKLIRSAIGTA